MGSVSIVQAIGGGIMSNQITIPINSDHSEEQLQSFVMALILSYGLVKVLDAIHEGLMTHYDEIRMDGKIQRPVLDSINVASVVAEQLLEEV
ncbi:MAG: hypothetical protein AAGA46_03450 [Cyanobacteria bacterium P01_F01_bin.13]